MFFRIATIILSNHVYVFEEKKLRSLSHAQKEFLPVFYTRHLGLYGL